MTREEVEKIEYDEKFLRKRAYCGDGLLRYSLGIIFFHPDRYNPGWLTRLAENRILLHVVLFNYEIFKVKYKGDSKKYSPDRYGTIYEAHLFHVCHAHGLEACVNFVRESFLIKDGMLPYDVYAYWRHLEWTKTPPK